MDFATYDRIMAKDFECDWCEETFPASERVALGEDLTGGPGTGGVMWSCRKCHPPHCTVCDGGETPSDGEVHFYLEIADDYRISPGYYHAACALKESVERTYREFASSRPF